MDGCEALEKRLIVGMLFGITFRCDAFTIIDKNILFLKYNIDNKQMRGLVGRCE
jgi:hypothetical protein